MTMDSETRVEMLPESGWETVAYIHPLVYPPENPHTAIWAAVQWADAEHRFVLSQGGQPVSHAALHIREGLANGRPVRLAGIGGVMTHPAHQKQGHARRLLQAAIEEASRQQADFALLVCEKKNIGFYEAQGWRVFPGHMIDQQSGASREWTLSPVMVRDLGRRAPRGGMIDLRGLPW